MSATIETANSKSPLESKTVQVAILGLVTAIVSHFNPTIGEWVGSHQELILGALSAATVYGRSGADQKLNWRNWTIKGFGIKF